MSYKQLADDDGNVLAGLILRLRDGAYIPTVRGNLDYETFLQWERAGNIIQPADPIPAPVLDARQARRSQKMQARLDIKNTGLTVPQRLQALLIALDLDL